nr:CYP4AP4 protein [Diaphanosoma celebensis]
MSLDLFLLVSLCCILVVTIPIVAWILWMKYSKFGQLVNRIPGPGPIPLLGNVLDIAGDCEHILHTMHEKWPTMYGEIYRFFVGSRAAVVVSSPELIEPVISSQSVTEKGFGYQVLRPWLGLGLLTGSGARYKARRKSLTPAFHLHIMENFFDAFNEQSSVLCSRIGHLCSATGRAEVNVEKLTSLCTLDIICETAMGCKVHAQTQQSPYVEAVCRLMPLLMQKSLRPMYRIDAFYWLNAKGRQYYRSLKIVLEFTNQIIKQRRQQFQSSIAEETDDGGFLKRRPFLDLLLELSASGNGLTDREIADEVNTFMFEGHDTTAMTLNWFLHSMAANPQHQERVCVELDQVFGDSNRPCTKEDLSQLKYLECCIKETMRLYPAVPSFSRRPTEPIQIGDYTVPAGHLSFVISAYAMHRNPRVYPEPLVFNPERFSLENSAGRHPYAFIPFSAGPRNCIGQRFAMAEVKVVLSSLLRRFKFQLSPTAAAARPSIELTLKSADGIRLLVSRR